MRDLALQSAYTRRITALNRYRSVTESSVALPPDRAATMPSSDHYGQELREQLQRAATRRISHLLVNEHDLHSSLRDLHDSDDKMVSCRLAMRTEMKVGDVILVTESNTAGMTVRYVLPRASP
jgi:hypothetical protein